MAALRNKTALVTGASRGIGRATALALAEAGAHVLVHYGRSVQDAESLVADIRSKEGRADAIRADLGTPQGATLLAKEVRSIVGERLDVLVSNAGISKAATIKDHTVEDFDILFATNVRGPFFLVQQLLTVLGEGSSIIVISSIGAHAVVGKPGLDNPSLLLGGASGLNYAADYREVDGIVVPTKRRVYAPDANKREIAEPVLVAIDIQDVSFSAD
jgi:NAD(P)-dependent dehydrogenase (short-subunit alcohol dehydrogenase family)